MSGPLDQLCINTVRFVSVDAVQQANSGHPGLPLGAAAMAYVLWTRLLKHNPRNPDWFDRDRFVLSAGHGSMLLYDDNRVTLAAATDIAFSEDRARRFEAYGWHTLPVADGNDLAALDAALRAARAETARPSPPATPTKPRSPGGSRWRRAIARWCWC